MHFDVQFVNYFLKCNIQSQFQENITCVLRKFVLDVMLLWFGCESWCVFGPAGLFECSFRLFPCVSLSKINRSPHCIASGGLLPGVLMAIHIHLQPACGTTGVKPDWHVHAHTHTRTYTAMCDWQVIVAEHTYTEILRRHAKHGSRSRRTKKINEGSHTFVCGSETIVYKNLCLYVLFYLPCFKVIVYSKMTILSLFNYSLLGTTWGWVNDVRSFSFVWTIPLYHTCLICSLVTFLTI